MLVLPFYVNAIDRIVAGDLFIERALFEYLNVEIVSFDRHGATLVNWE